VNDQVYIGAKVSSKKIQRAIKETREELLFINGKLTKIYYHSRCGGHTDSEKTVWGMTNETHIGVPCPFCRNKAYSWTATMPIFEFKKALKLPLSFLSRTVKISTLSLPSGRKHSIQVRLNKKRLRISAETLRRRLGYSRIKSARFSWKMDKNLIRFRGTGAGHGVGLCQWGTKHLAEAGMLYQEILAHYYPHAQIASLKPKIIQVLQPKPKNTLVSHR